MNYNKLLTGILGSSLLVSLLCGCNGGEATTENTNNTATTPVITELETTDMFSDRDKDPSFNEATAVAINLAEDKSTCNSSGVTVKDNTITITKEGTYLLSGSLTAGQIIVDAKDQKVQLVLSNVSIVNNTGAAVYVKDADKVFVTLAENTKNTLSNEKEFTDTADSGVDGVIFSKDDLTINGSVILTVNSANGHGIVSKDELTITGGA